MPSQNVLEVAVSRRIKGVWKCELKRSQGGRGGEARFWGERSAIEKVRQDVAQPSAPSATKSCLRGHNSSIMPVKSGLSANDE